MTNTEWNTYQELERRRNAACLESYGNECRVFVTVDRGGRPVLWMGVSGVMGRGFAFDPATARELAHRLLLAADGVDPITPCA